MIAHFILVLCKIYQVLRNSSHSFLVRTANDSTWAHSEKQARARMDFTSCQLYRSTRPKPKPKPKPSRDQGQDERCVTRRISLRGKQDKFSVGRRNVQIGDRMRSSFPPWKINQVSRTTLDTGYQAPHTVHRIISLFFVNIWI